MADALSELWGTQQHAAFPPSCQGTPLLKLDAELGRVLTACLRKDGAPRPLSPAQREALERGRAALRAALAGSVPDDGRAYFERLLSIAEAL